MTSTAVLRYMERADRATVLCHAIRHLLDHTNPFPREWMRGDMDAIDLMQVAMDGPEPKCEWEMGESSYGAGDSLPCGRPADKSGFCDKHRGLV